MSFESVGQRNSRSAVFESVRTAVVTLTKCSEADVFDQAELSADLGLDSFMLADLINRVERHLQQRLPRGVEARIAGATTVEQLVDLFAATLAPDAATMQRGR